MAQQRGTEKKRTMMEARREAERILRDPDLKREIDRLLNRSDAEKRRAVETLLQDEKWAGRSNREIARQCIVHKDLVRKVREQLTGSGVLDTVKASRGGGEYTIATSKLRAPSKKKRGRKAGETLIDYGEFVANVKACVLEEWAAKGRSITEVRQEAVLARYHGMGPGNLIALSTLKSRLVEAGYKEKWPAFVEATVKEQTSG